MLLTLGIAAGLLTLLLVVSHLLSGDDEPGPAEYQGMTRWAQ